MARFNDQCDLIVKLTEEGVRLLETSVWFGPYIDLREDGGGKIKIRIPVQKISFFADLIWQLGGEARILEPAAAVDYIKQKIETTRQLYL